MSVSSGSDRIAFEEQPAGPAGPTGPAGPAGPAYREYTAVGAYSLGKVGAFSGSGITVASSADGVDGIFGNSGADGTTARIYPSGALVDVTGAGLPTGDVYLDVATGNAVLYGSLMAGNPTRYLGYCTGTKLTVQIGDSFTV